MSKEINRKNKINWFDKKIIITTIFALVTFLLYFVISSSSIADLSTNSIISVYLSIPFFNEVYATTESSKSHNLVLNQISNMDLDGVNLSLYPRIDHNSGITVLTMKISDSKTGFPLTHVDWVIKIKTPKGKEAFKSSTMHSHIGINEFSYKFLETGKNTVSIQLASTGPTLLGMEYPAPAHTRIFKSGEFLTGWTTDPAYFFGTRTAEFSIEIPQIQEKNMNLSNITYNFNRDDVIDTNTPSSSNITNNENSVKILNGSENGTKVKLELVTIPKKIISGKPVTLILNVKNAMNDTLVTHPDVLLSINGKSDKLLQSSPAGNSIIPTNGAFHGHTGEKVITTVFPSSGKYVINMNVSSIPGLSTYHFGQIKTSFDLDVVDDDNNRNITTAIPSSNQMNSAIINTAIPVTNNSNHIAIIGQDAPYYIPQSFTIKQNTVLTFKNHDGVVHTATGTDVSANIASPTANNSFDTGILFIGQEKQISFSNEGTYNYFCNIHPYMRGTIIVTN